MKLLRNDFAACLQRAQGLFVSIGCENEGCHVWGQEVILAKNRNPRHPYSGSGGLFYYFRRFLCRVDVCLRCVSLGLSPPTCSTDCALAPIRGSSESPVSDCFPPTWIERETGHQSGSHGWDAHAAGSRAPFRYWPAWRTAVTGQSSYTLLSTYYVPGILLRACIQHLLYA